MTQFSALNNVPQQQPTSSGLVAPTQLFSKIQTQTPVVQQPQPSKDFFALTQTIQQPVSPSNLLVNLFAKAVDIPIYTTYGTPQEVTIKGRVLENKGTEQGTVDDSWKTNLKRNLQALESDEIKGANVNVTFNGKTYQTTTDKEGHFELKLTNPGPLTPGYHPVEAKLSPGQSEYYSLPSQGQVIIQNANDTTLGVISDIDDTIKKSEVTSKLKLLKNVLFKNEASSEPIKGMAELFQGIDQKTDGVIDGDVHYVSGSPVNLFPLLKSFMAINQFPAGSLDLKQLGVSSNTDSLTEQIGYKLGKIRNVFNTYPNKKFVLVGDSGEKDPEIYQQIAKEFPGRVQAIYINNVTGEQANSPRFQGMLLTNGSAGMAADAYQKGLIDQTALAKVQQAAK